MSAQPASFLATRRGKLTLLLLCAVQFLDITDSSIMNVALPSIRRDLGFSVQNLQWVLSGYLVTYGGFLLLGGRAADLLGRRRLLVTGTAVFAACSLAGGLAVSAGMLIGARLGQGAGAAMMAPAGLSILTTTFAEGSDRNRALGAWGAVSGLAAATGVFFGGVLSAGPGWRWVLFVNLPVCALVVAGAYRLVSGERRRAQLRNFGSAGAILATGGMLLLVYTLVRAPGQGWGSARTIGELASAAVLLAVFVATELRSRNPLFPFSIFRIRGLAAADATQMIAFAGFVSMFFFLTLYMQNVLGYSPIKGGSAYLPVTAGIAVAAGISARLFARTGTRPVIVAGSLIAAGAMYYLSRVPVHGSYLTDLLPGLVIMSIGLGGVFVAVTTAASAGVPAGQAGLAAGLLNTSQQLGTALGLAIFSAVATSRTNDLLAAHAPRAAALTSGFHRALLASAIFLLAAAVIALRGASTRGETQTPPSRAPGTRTRSGPGRLSRAHYVTSRQHSGGDMTTTTTQAYQLFIRATAQQIWDAITKPEHSSKYLYGAHVETTGEPGSSFRYYSPDRSALWGDEMVLDSDPPGRLVVGYRALYDPELAAEKPSRVTWQIEPDQDGISLLTVVHDRLEDAPKTARRVAGAGWMRVLSGLKTLLETGEPLSM
jgi:EmrB/QacA subfamily drug resistance transporter